MDSDEVQLRAELTGSYNAHEAAQTRAELEAIRAEADRICRETIARGQAAQTRAKVPAPPAPPFHPGGIRERALAVVLANRRGRE